MLQQFKGHLLLAPNPTPARLTGWGRVYPSLPESACEHEILGWGLYRHRYKYRYTYRYIGSLTRTFLLSPSPQSSWGVEAGVGMRSVELGYFARIPPPLQTLQCGCSYCSEVRALRLRAGSYCRARPQLAFSSQFGSLEPLRAPGPWSESEMY